MARPGSAREPPSTSDRSRWERTWRRALPAAANLALTSVLGQGRDRAAALDLLTADTLVTLALLAQAETAPGSSGDSRPIL